MKGTRYTEGADELLQQLEQDIREWVEASTRFFSNERDLQVKLAKFLESKMSAHYDLVDTEYRVPLAELQVRGLDVPTKDAESADFAHFPWKNEISVDIVVGKGESYALVELKYSTRELAEQPRIFGEEMLTDSKILKNQAAGNLTMYNFWKDVRRIEAISEAFNNVAGGVALMVSNSRDVWNEPHAGALYTPFSTHHKNVFRAGMHSWPAGVSGSVLTQHPSFLTTGTYTCTWQTTAIRETAKNHDPFKYLLITIQNK